MHKICIRDAQDKVAALSWNSESNIADASGTVIIRQTVTLLYLGNS